MLKKSASIGSRIFDCFNVILMVVIILVTLYPFWNQFILSFAEKKYLYAVTPQWLPQSFDPSAYQAIMKYKDIWSGYANSIIRTVVGTILGVLVNAMIAYPLTKRDLPGKKFFTAMIIITMLFSGGTIPLYLLITKDLHLTNSFWALILPAIVSPYYIFILRNFFYSVPHELEEAALVDGAGFFRIFWQIVMPLSRPVLATVALWTGVGHWQAWYDNLLYLQKPANWGLQMILRELLVQTQSDNILTAVASAFGSTGAVDERQLKCAVVVISVLPMLIVYPFLQEYMNKGVVLGAVKG